MGLFRKRFPSKSEINQGAEAADWAVGEGAIDGRPAILRVWKPADKLRGHPEFRHQVGVAVPFRAPTEQGLPTPAENAEVNRIEDLLTHALCENNDSLFVGTITTGGMKEFVFYTSSPEIVPKQVEAIRKSIATHQIQLNVQADPDWSVHRDLFSW